MLKGDPARGVFTECQNIQRVNSAARHERLKEECMRFDAQREQEIEKPDEDQKIACRDSAAADLFGRMEFPY